MKVWIMVMSLLVCVQTVRVSAQSDRRLAISVSRGLVVSSRPSTHSNESGGLFQGIQSMFREVQAWIIEFFGGIFRGFREWIGNFFRGLFNGMKDFLSGLFNGIKEFFGGLFSGIRDFFSGLLGGLFRSITDWMRGIDTWWKGVWQGIKDFFKQLLAWLIFDPTFVHQQFQSLNQQIRQQAVPSLPLNGFHPNSPNAFLPSSDIDVFGLWQIDASVRSFVQLVVNFVVSFAVFLFTIRKWDSLFGR